MGQSCCLWLLCSMPFSHLRTPPTLLLLLFFLITFESTTTNGLILLSFSEGLLSQIFFGNLPSPCVPCCILLDVTRLLLPVSFCLLCWLLFLLCVLKFKCFPRICSLYVSFSHLRRLHPLSKLPTAPPCRQHQKLHF